MVERFVVAQHLWYKARALSAIYTVAAQINTKGRTINYTRAQKPGIWVPGS